MILVCSAGVPHVVTETMANTFENSANTLFEKYSIPARVQVSAQNDMELIADVKPISA